jgi:hypothetical protein
MWCSLINFESYFVIKAMDQRYTMKTRSQLSLHCKSISYTRTSSKMQQDTFSNHFTDFPQSALAKAENERR